MHDHKVSPVLLLRYKLSFFIVFPKLENSRVVFHVEFTSGEHKALSVRVISTRGERMEIMKVSGKERESERARARRRRENGKEVTEETRTEKKNGAEE